MLLSKAENFRSVLNMRLEPILPYWSVWIKLSVQVHTRKAMKYLARCRSAIGPFPQSAREYDSIEIPKAPINPARKAKLYLMQV
jgi:hypothetical protein